MPPGRGGRGDGMGRSSRRDGVATGMGWGGRRGGMGVAIRMGWGGHRDGMGWWSGRDGVAIRMGWGGHPDGKGLPPPPGWGCHRNPDGVAIRMGWGLSSGWDGVWSAPPARSPHPPPPQPATACAEVRHRAPHQARGQLPPTTKKKKLFLIELTYGRFPATAEADRTRWVYEWGGCEATRKSRRKMFSRDDSDPSKASTPHPTLGPHPLPPSPDPQGEPGGGYA